MNKKINFSNLIDHLHRDVSGLRERMSSEGIVSQVPGAMPLLNAITSFEDVDDRLWIELSARQWGERALVEGAITRISKLYKKIS